MNTVRERKGGVVSRHAKNPLGFVTLWWQKKKIRVVLLRTSQNVYIGGTPQQNHGKPYFA